MVIYVWLLSPSMMFLRFIHEVAGQNYVSNGRFQLPQPQNSLKMLRPPAIHVVLLLLFISPVVSVPHGYWVWLHSYPVLFLLSTSYGITWAEPSGPLQSVLPGLDLCSNDTSSKGVLADFLTRMASFVMAFSLALLYFFSLLIPEIKFLLSIFILILKIIWEYS